MAHIPDSYYTGYVAMYASDRTQTESDKNDNYQDQKVACPQFKLQPGVPADRCLSMHLPRINLGTDKLLQPRKVSLACGLPISLGSCAADHKMQH